MEDLGRRSRKPMEKKTFETFMKKSELKSHAREMFGDTRVYDAAMYVGKKLSKGVDLETLQNDDYVQSMRELILSVAPHKMIVDKLKEIADDGNKNALNMIATMLGDAKIAETASLGQVARERIRAVEGLMEILTRKDPAVESELQRLLESAPWLINPQWTVLQANQTFNTFKKTFGAWFKKEAKRKAKTFEGGALRPDFIMYPIESRIEIVEIKRPGHKLDDVEFERLSEYITMMDDYLGENREHGEKYPMVHATLVCDGLNLGGVGNIAHGALVKDGRLRRETWQNLLAGATRAHEDFLNAMDDIFRESRKTNS